MTEFIVLFLLISLFWCVVGPFLATFTVSKWQSALDGSPFLLGFISGLGYCALLMFSVFAGLLISLAARLAEFGETLGARMSGNMPEEME